MMNETQEKLNILLVDDQPAKLLSYEAILHDLGENLLKAKSGREALEYLLKTEVAVVLLDVCMPDLDGFQLAAMIREHPRFQKTAMIFISAIHLSEMDRLRGYEMGAVDYVPVPVVPEVLRAKVKIFSELYRKTRELERWNDELEQRVAARTSDLEQSNAQLLRSEERRSLALTAGKMGSWNWERDTNEFTCDEGQCRIFGVDPSEFKPTAEKFRALIHPDDWATLQPAWAGLAETGVPFQAELRIQRTNGEIVWCISSAAATLDGKNRVLRLSGVTVDITERKLAEERQSLLASEVDHRARNALAIVQSILRLTKSDTVGAYTSAVEGRIKALSLAHSLLSQSRWTGADLRRLLEEELAPYKTEPEKIKIEGPNVNLGPASAQTLALTFHEMATNAAKYGALSMSSGSLSVTWEMQKDDLVVEWIEKGISGLSKTPKQGLGTKIVTQSIGAQLGGRVAIEWREHGLRCVLHVPIKNIRSLGKTNGALKAGGNHTPHTLKNNKILVVEDESLVAMEIANFLGSLGFDVVGPCSTLSDALRMTEKHDFDGAILDINLAGDLVYPLADILVKRRKPFVFVTGYRAESVEQRFIKIPVLQKPIDRGLLAGIFVSPQKKAYV